MPVKSATTYIGVKVKGDVGRKIPIGSSSSIEPFAGLALWAWSRTVDDSTAEDGTPAFGYTEDWTTLHARLGLRAGAGLSPTAKWFAEGGIKLPLYNENYAHIGSGITLHPGRETSFFAETGVVVRAFKVSLTYDGLRFSLSSPSDGFVQPNRNPISTV